MSAYLKFPEFLLRHRILVVVLIVAVSLFFLDCLGKVRLNDRLETFMFKSSELEHMDDFLSESGHGEVIVIAFEAEGSVLAREELGVIRELAKGFEGLDHVQGTLSLANLFQFDLDEEAGLPVMERYIRGDLTRQELVEKIESVKPYRKFVLSEDHTASAIYEKLDAEASTDSETQKAVVRQIKEVAEMANTGNPVRVHMAGVPLLTADINERSFRDLKRFVPLSMILVVTAMFLIFRNFFLTLIPFITVTIAVIWTIGLISLVTGELNTITVLVPTMIFVIATSDCVHILSNYNDSVFGCANVWQGILRTFRLSFIPCLLTTTTTIAGFWAMMVSGVKPIREMGFYTGIGIGFGFLIAMTLIPIALSSLRAEHVPEYMDKKGPSGGKTRQWLKALSDFSRRKNRPFVVLTFVLVGLLAFFITRLNVDKVASGWFGEENRRAYDFVNTHFPGSGHMYAKVEVTGSGPIYSPEVLRRMEALENYLEGYAAVDASGNRVSLIGNVNSLMDMIKYARFKLFENDETYYQLPDTKEEAAQLLLLAEAANRDDFVQSLFERGEDETLLSINGKSHDFELWMRFVEDAKAYAKENLSPLLRFEPVGSAYLKTKIHEPLIQGIQKGLIVAVALVSIMMLLLFRSWKVMLIAAVPNLLPVMITFGLMGLLDIPINLFTAPFVCIALGLAVDDTVHFLSRFRIELRMDGDYGAAMERTMLSVGRALILTSIVFMAGFLIFLVSSFQISRNFGALISFTIVGALFSDLFVLPRLLLRFRPFPAQSNPVPVIGP